MIDPRELRIGNLIGLEDAFDSRQYYAVFEIIYDGLGCQIGVENSALLLHETSYRPIPISPEWLERLGFEKDNKNPMFPLFALDYKNGIGMLTHTMEIYYDEMMFKPIGSWIAGNHTFWIRHVHQLQNLFYALTGTELTVKEPQTLDVKESQRLTGETGEWTPGYK